MPHDGLEFWRHKLLELEAEARGEKVSENDKGSGKDAGSSNLFDALVGRLIKVVYSDSGGEVKVKLKADFETRWKRLCKTSVKYGIAPPSRAALWDKLKKKFYGGFKCAYCGETLMIKDYIPPHHKSFSIDHKVSLFIGGTNSIDNLEIVCHRCNIIKGAMRHDTFTELLNFCPQSLIDRMFGEIWAGRMADKLGREEALT